MLFNNPEVVRYIAENFVGVASDDVAYNGLSAEAKSRGEFQFLRNALAEGGQQLHQGVFAVSSSGKFLGKIDGGWPLYDSAIALKNLRKANTEYSAFDRANRVASSRLAEVDRSLKKSRLENGYLKLVNAVRHYDFAEMERFDVRHPVYTKRDALWLTQREVHGLLPDSLEKGAEKAVESSVVDKLLLHGHLMSSCPPWWREHITKKQMHVSVKQRDGDLVYLRYTGNFRMQADSQWNKSAYRGKLLGRAEWNSASNSFESLEWVSLGERELQELKSNLHRGSTKETKVAAVLRLAKNTLAEQDLKPHKLNEYK